MIRVIRHHAPAGALPLLITEIILACGCFYAAGMVLFGPDPSIYFLWEGGAPRVLLGLATLLMALYFFDLYKEPAVTSRVALAQQLCQAVGVMLLAQSVVSYVQRDWIVPHWLMLYSSGYILVALYLWRLIYSAAVLRAVGKERVLFVGRSETVEEVREEMMSDPASGCEVIGVVDEGGLGPLSSLKEFVARYRPHRVVVGLPERRGVMPVADLLDLRFSGCRVEEAGQAYETSYRRVCLRETKLKRVIFSRELCPPPESVMLTGLGSRLIASLLVLLLWPFILLIALALRLRARGPVLAPSECVGREGRRFRLLRFRKAPGLGPLYHRLHLDALPELLNVMRGEMAIVGPRPETVESAAERAALHPLHEFRQNVLPGMTGWAQINLVEDEPTHPMLALEYDLYYVKYMSQSLNTYILIATLKNRVLRG